MRGDLDETLARLARREEALRRRGTVPGGAADRDGPPPPDPAVTGREGYGAHRLRGGTRPAQPDPVTEVAEAVRRVVAEHPGLAVTLRVEQGGQAYPLRVAWTGHEVKVVAVPAPPPPPPAWPAPVAPVRTAGPDPADPDPAARLAEMVRRDPSLLEDPGPR